MDILPAKIRLTLLAFLYLALLIQARLNLDRSDSDAVKLFKNDLGFNGQLDIQENLCNSAGIHCEIRITSGNSPILRVTRIVLDSKRLNGTLSPVIGRFSELKVLSLPNNDLVDQIPSEIVDCRKLQVLNLRNNRLSGKIPSEFSSLVSLRILDLSSNRFSGDLSFLKYLKNLENLSLSDNLFTGKVPAFLYTSRRLRFLNLSGNDYLQFPVQTTKNIINSRTELRTKNFLPRRYVFAEKASAPSASKATHSNPSAPSASKANNPNSSEAHPPSSHKHKKDNKKKVRGWIIGFIVGVIGGILSGLLFSMMFKFLMMCIKGREKETSTTIFSQMIKKAEDLAFLEKEDGLASLEIIGRGGCGEVYKAELPGSNGKMIAIKKINQPQLDVDDLTGGDSKNLTKKMRQIRSEIQTVGKIRHRNLLSLLAHVSRPDCHYLVYEYMKNGSLHDTLKQVSEGTTKLDWLLRHSISLGVAAGLEYLHMNHSPRIIHRDLKPANVLLDDDLEARIADFGLAKAIPDANTHVTTSNVAGTVGYIAPEYHQTLKFTDKCDIYSFGVLLAVLVTGKLPSDEFFQHTEEMSQVKWLRNVMTSENPRRAIDPNLIGNGYEEQMLLVLKIACFCTLEDPKERPNSKEVGCMLSQIKH
ncbi:Protein kinase domain [Macleaya cordata]|uniref:Protein kinase domain n=1 Tax=Macleaya cordata TaxID=56857 RepID=A0A200RCX7_MACCD|nr:Protein kinase domain [Macleaya cordata]